MTRKRYNGGWPKRPSRNDEWYETANRIRYGSRMQTAPPIVVDDPAVVEKARIRAYRMQRMRDRKEENAQAERERAAGEAQHQREWDMMIRAQEQEERAMQDAERANTDREMQLAVQKQERAMLAQRDNERIRAQRIQEDETAENARRARVLDEEVRAETRRQEDDRAVQRELIQIAWESPRTGKPATRLKGRGGGLMLPRKRARAEVMKEVPEEEFPRGRVIPRVEAEEIDRTNDDDDDIQLLLQD